jgi:hypothetical protein
MFPASDAHSRSASKVDLYFFYGMVGRNMARLIDIVVSLHTGIAGAVARADFSRLLLTPGTLAFLTSAR